MLDGDGNVRITDFGIATAAADVGAAVAGTPQYMAPELLAGKAASAKSDIYALGLILFEIFTGRRAYDAKTISDLKQLHDTGTLVTPSAIVRDLDPAVERAVMCCLARAPAVEPAIWRGLARDPERRPASALTVAVALPGGDPLAAALAAGETPSPEMLVAAGERDALPVVKGLAAVMWVIAGLLAAAALAPRLTYARLVPLDKPPAVLADRAEQILASIGLAGVRGDTAEGFQLNADYLEWVARADAGPRRWQQLTTGSPPALTYWYRASPRDLVPRVLA